MQDNSPFWYDSQPVLSYEFTPVEVAHPSILVSSLSSVCILGARRGCGLGVRLDAELLILILTSCTLRKSVLTSLGLPSLCEDCLTIK